MTLGSLGAPGSSSDTASDKGGIPVHVRPDEMGDAPGAEHPIGIRGRTPTSVTSGERRDNSVDELSDLERSRLLLGWLAARRAVDHCLSDLLAAGPAGERRVREQLALVDDLESRAQRAFDRYRAAAENTDAGPAAGESPAATPYPGWGASADRPRLNVVRGAPDTELSRSNSNTQGHRRHR
jgi:hypothetical protein